ncbi:MAG: Gfo/Idh/MocA family oxidoreductase [Sedimentisphaerales bacterium]|nr:Gfo/Idh/MocA family oxidoreductase [Sedimentisphaerales bacterium]
MAKRGNLRIGIVGSGFMGRTYAECLARYNERARPAAVAGGKRAPKLAADYGLEHIPNVTDLIARADIDALVLTTPDIAHLEEIQLAAAAGKHVLVEKPMAPNVSQAQTIIETCDRAGVILMVVQSQRFRRAHQLARSWIDEGRIGAVQQIRHWGFQTLDSSLKMVGDRPFYLDEAGGGLFMGFSVHAFDMVRWLAGDNASSIFAQINRYGAHHIPNSSSMAQIAFEHGAMAQVWSCLELPGHVFSLSQFRTQIVGERGLLDVDGYSHFDAATEKGWERVFEQPPLNPMNPSDPVRLEAYINMVQEYIDAVLENRTPSVTGADGKAAVELCQAALQSSEKRRPVLLPLEP